MSVFATILENLQQSKDRLNMMRTKLVHCQDLLRCKRDGLKKLWLDLVENRSILELLEQIEQVMSLPAQIDSSAAKKHYLHAAQCCVDGLQKLGEYENDDEDGSDKSQVLDSKGSHQKQLATKVRYNDSAFGSLQSIGALHEVRRDLLNRRDTLFEAAIDELHRHIYNISTAEVRSAYFKEALAALAAMNAEQNEEANAVNGNSSTAKTTLDLRSEYFFK